MANELYGQAARMAHDLKVARDSYRTAEIYYANLRDKFISQLGVQQQEIEKKSYEIMCEQVNEELSKIAPEEMFDDKQIEKLDNYIKTLAKTLVTSDISDQIKAAKGRQTGDYGVGEQEEHRQLRNLSKTMKSYLNAYIQSDRMTNTLLNYYRKAFEITTGRTATVQALYGLLRREMVASVLRNDDKNPGKEFVNSAKSYISNFRGDLGEIIGTRGLNAFKTNCARQVGDITTSSGEQSKYDIIVGRGAQTATLPKLTNILNNFEVMDQNITIQIDLLNSANYQYMGGQVKSWYPPGVEAPLRANTTYHPIGSRKEIYDAYGFGIGDQNDVNYERGWHYSASVLGLNIIKVLGSANVFYITGGNQFTWTTDLIQTFRQAKYYLTFYYPRKANKDKDNRYDFEYPGQPEVVWQLAKIRLKRRVKKF